MLQSRPAAGAILQLVKGSNIFQSGPYTVLQAEEEEMVEGLARAVQAPPPGKRVNKSRAASSGPLVNPARYNLSQTNENDTLLFLTRQVQTRFNS